MNDIYNKPDKGGRKQQIRSRLARLGDELRRVKAEEQSILEDMSTLRVQLLEEG